MQHNKSELTLISFNSISLNLIEFTAVNNLVAMDHKQYKHTVSKAHLRNMKFINFKMIEAMGLKIIASTSP
jgi:hypothetical protein